MVWDALESIDGHATAQQILRAIEQRGVEPGKINQSSVYRTLQLFSELGLVRESRTDAMGSSTWEVRHADSEIHLICDSCGTVVHHATPIVESLDDELVATGFVANAIDVQVNGRCRRCR